MIGAQLQAAIYTSLAGVAGGRVYDRPPASPVFPYVTIGDEQVIDDGNACADGWEVFPDVHVWSRSVSGSKAELKGLVAQIVPLVTAITTVTGFAVIAAELRTVRSLRDPDGLTEHAVLNFRFLIDPS